jgi:hypothetical protein
LSRLELWAGERVRIGLELEIGLSTLPVRATVEEEEVFSMAGVWINSGLTLGVGF